MTDIKHGSISASLRNTCELVIIIIQLKREIFRLYDWPNLSRIIVACGIAYASNADWFIPIRYGWQHYYCIKLAILFWCCL